MYEKNSGVEMHFFHLLIISPVSLAVLLISVHIISP